MNRFIVRKNRLCLLLLLSLLFFVRVSFAEKNGDCVYTISDGVLTIGPDSTPGECTLEDNPFGNTTTYPWYGDTSITKVNIQSGVKTPDSPQRLFEGLSGVNEWLGLDNLNVSGSTKTDYMFYNCSGLTSLGALEEWDVSNVTAMSYMFRGCSGLISLDGIKSWQVGKVTEMVGMFYGCSGLTSLDGIKSWQVGKVTSMGGMFEGCSSLTNLDALTDWDVDSVTKMPNLFRSCSGLTSLDGIKSWNVVNVQFIYGMFEGCSSLTSLDALKGWVLSSVTNMNDMFKNCTAVTKADFSQWDFSKSGLYHSNTLSGVKAAIKLNQYYKNMYGTKLYVYGKHSYRDFGTNGDKTNLTSDPSNLVFEPYTVAITYTGGTGSSSISEASNQHTAAEAYYDAVKDWKGSDPYDEDNYYFKYDGGGTLTFTPATGYIVQSITDGSTQTASNSITLSAITADHAIEVALQPAPATVTYSAGDGTGTPPVPYNGHYFDTITLPSGEGLSKPGSYGFAGWSDGSNTYKAGDSYTVNAANVTMSAVYLHKVTYAAGDAETGDVPAEEIYVAGDTVIVKGNTGNLARPGYSFAGWSDGTNPLYAAGSDFEMPSDNITLTAQFTQNPAYTLTFAKETDVSGDVPAAISVVAGITTKLPKPGNLTKPGYSFAGWSDGTNPPYAAEYDFEMPNNDVTLTAQFTQNPSYTLTFAAGADVSGDVPLEISVIAGTTTTLPAQGNLTKPGYSFAGWSDGEYTYAAGAAFTMPFNHVTLTAVFNALPTYTISYIKDTDVAGTLPAAASYWEGATVTVAGGETLSKAGYVFAGWNDGSKTYTAGESFTMPDHNVTLTAVFEKVYTVTYEKDADVSGDVPAAATYKAGAAVTVSGNTGNLAKSGCVFSGWLYDGLTYDAGRKFTMPDKDITMKAQFTQNAVSHTLTFADEQGTPLNDPAAMQVYSGTRVVLPGNLVKTGWNFFGWRDSAAIYAAGSSYLMPSNDVTLYAEFKQDQPYQAVFEMEIPQEQKTKYGEAAENAEINIEDPLKIQQTWIEVKYAGETVELPKNEGAFTCKNKNTGVTYPFIGWIVKKAVSNMQQPNAVYSAEAGDAALYGTDDTTEYIWTNQQTTYTMKGYNVTLQPLFSYQQYSVTFDGDGADPATYPSEPQSYYYGEFAENFCDSSHASPCAEAPKKEGYTFTGWKDNKTGKIYAYNGKFVMPEENVTLTAQFAIDSQGYTLTYGYGDAQYGYPPIAETVPAWSSVTIRGNEGGLGKDGHEFTVWTDGSVEYIPGSSIVMPEADVYLYPLFTKVPDPLPEDEIGTYSFDEYGNKFYIQFHSYDICMNYMGDEDLCRNTSANLYNY